MLANRHANTLTSSGVPPELVSSRGYETIDDRSRLAEIRIARAGQLTPGLLIPLRDIRGSVWGFQYKPDNPRMSGNGERFVKYETPTGQSPRLDIPPGVGPMLADPSIPLLITEGTKKADCAVGRGLCCVALLGVWCFRGTNNLRGKVNIADWGDVALNDRRAIIAYDSDVMSKESVRAAMDELARYLKLKGARTEFLHLPDEGGKVGLDDYLVTHSVEEMWALVKPIPPRVKDPTAASQQLHPPKEPPAYGSIDGAALLDEVRVWFSRFICVLDDGDLDIMTLWSAHTHLVQELRTTPRLQIDSPIPESGKTTVLEHFERLCHRPLQIAQLSSSALIPRILEGGIRTLLLDEVDRNLHKDKPGVGDLIAILNSGYRTGATRPVLVQVAGGNWEPKEMSTFAPIAMAGNSPNLPADMMSRSLRVLMLPDVDDLSEETDWDEIEADALALAARLADWADSVRTMIQETKVDLPAGCTRRARERWRPLKRVAVMAGGRWPEVVDELIVRNLAEEEAEREDGLKHRPPGIVLLEDLHKVWPKEGEKFVEFVATTELVDLLVACDPDYWGAESPYGKALTTTRFGRMLSKAAKATSQRIGGEPPRGYLRSQLAQAWRRLGIEKVEKVKDLKDLTPPPNEPDEPDEPGGDTPADRQVRQVRQVQEREPEVPEVPQVLDFCTDCGSELTPEEVAGGYYCADCVDARLAPAHPDTPRRTPVAGCDP